MTLPRPLHFLLRVTRFGPLVPARIRWIDHEPGAPENKLDRGRLSVFREVDIAGEVRPPEELLDRIWEGDATRAPIEPSHWKYATRITEAEYRRRFAELRRAEATPGHPLTRPRASVDPRQIALPSFERENAP